MRILRSQQFFFSFYFYRTHVEMTNNCLNLVRQWRNIHLARLCREFVLYVLCSELNKTKWNFVDIGSINRTSYNVRSMLYFFNFERYLPLFKTTITHATFI